MKIERNKSLSRLNTFQVEALADYFVSIQTKSDIAELCSSRILNLEKLLILGGGSNMLFTDDFKGLVVCVGMMGMEYKTTNDDYTILEVGAGESWHNLVKITVKNKLYGLENMALIPGRVGAAPVQNIGAYGTEQESVFEYAECVEIDTGNTIRLTRSECDFSYRNSVFKKELKDKVILTNVAYRLSKKPLLNITYRDLQNEKDKFGITDPDQQWVFDTVCRIRQNKLPDLDVIGNAGSFFKNPIVTENKLNKLKELDPTLPSFPTDKPGYVKVSAARLIELCGWKGRRIGDAGVYEKHSLILVNHGNATGAEIKSLAMEIISSVNDKFGITLEPEVIFV